MTVPGRGSGGSLVTGEGRAVLDLLASRFPVIVYAMARDGTCTFSAGAPLARVGLVPGEAVGRHMLELSVGDDVAQGHLRAALAGWPVTYTWTSVDSRSRFETWLHPVRDDLGEVTSVVALALDVTDSWRAEASEHARVVEQQDVLHQLMAVQDAERQRISAGLHDDTVQVLAALALRVSTLRRRDDGLDVTTRNELSAMSRDLSDAGNRLRDMVAGLQPELLTRSGLAQALRDLLAQAFRRDRTDVRVEVPEDGSEPSEFARRVLYEVAVEAVGNARKHSGARAVRVVVARQGAGWRLEVVDDGCGTDQDGHGSAGFGLRSMRQRAVAAGGTLELLSSPGAGTTVRALVPDVPPFLAHAQDHDHAVAVHDVRGPLEHVLQNVSDAFVALDTSWRYVYANRRAAELFGTTPDQLVGQTIWQLFPEGGGTSFQEAYETAAREQRQIEVEDYFAPADRWYRNRILPSPSGLTIFIEDVTERRRLLLRQEDTDIGSRVAHTWFTALASETDCSAAVVAAVRAVVGTGLVRGLAVLATGLDVSDGEHDPDGDVVPVVVGGRDVGEVRVSWPGGGTAWTAELAAMLGQALAGRLAPGAPSAPAARDGGRTS